jgi:hypothetical protein
MLPECFLFVDQRTHFEGYKVLEPRLLIQYDRRFTSKVSFPNPS